MKLGKLSSEKFELMRELIARGKCESLKYLCNGIVLEDFQTMMVAWILIMRTFICTLDTGLGKTIVASAVMKWLHNTKETDKFLYVVENAGMSQTAKKVSMYTGLTVRTCNASESQALSLLSTDINDFDILMISYQALQSFGVAQFLVHHTAYFDTVIYDECQWISELNDSNTWEITKQMRKHFRDVIMFSATPFKTDPMQLLKQVELLDSTILGNINSYISDKCTRSLMYEITDWYGLDTIRSDLTLYVNGYTRDELGIGIKYFPHAYVCDSIEEQTTVKAHDMYRIKSYGDAETMHTLLNIVNDSVMELKQGIIYCSTNENKKLLLNTLTANGIACDVIDGTVSDKKRRQYTIDKYNSGELSVLILNITTTLDLPSDYCIFYELCDAGTILQFIGRCVRGIADSELDVHFILANNTYEITYFYNSIYRKSLYIQQILGKDDRLMKAIRSQVDRLA